MQQMLAGHFGDLPSTVSLQLLNYNRFIIEESQFYLSVFCDLIDKPELCG